MTREEEPYPEEQVSFPEAVEMVGRKPDSSERKDLITYWGFERKSWRWCIDTRMTLEDAIKLHRQMGDELRLIGRKRESTPAKNGNRETERAGEDRKTEERRKNPGRFIPFFSRSRTQGAGEAESEG